MNHIQQLQYNIIPAYYSMSVLVLYLKVSVLVRFMVRSQRGVFLNVCLYVIDGFIGRTCLA